MTDPVPDSAADWQPTWPSIAAVMHAVNTPINDEGVEFVIEPEDIAGGTMCCAYCNQRYGTLDGFPNLAFAECWKCTLEHYYELRGTVPAWCRVGWMRGLVVGNAVTAPLLVIAWAVTR